MHITGGHAGGSPPIEYSGLAAQVRALASRVAGFAPWPDRSCVAAADEVEQSRAQLASLSRSMHTSTNHGFPSDVLTRALAVARPLLSNQGI